MLGRKKDFKKSYSQSGEDAIIDFLFETHGEKVRSWIDIGCHDPYKLSNTAMFYAQGAHGVNIDANPACVEAMRRCRRRDVNLNIGVGGNGGELDFFVMNPSTMSTFSKQQAEALCEKYGFKICEVKKIPVYNINTVVDEFCGGVFPDLLCIDAEGVDFDIIKSIDFNDGLRKKK